MASKLPNGEVPIKRRHSILFSLLSASTSRFGLGALRKAVRVLSQAKSPVERQSGMDITSKAIFLCPHVHRRRRGIAPTWAAPPRKMFILGMSSPGAFVRQQDIFADSHVCASSRCLNGGLGRRTMILGLSSGKFKLCYQVEPGWHGISCATPHLV